MTKLELTKEARAALVERVRDYFSVDLDQDIGVLPAELLLQFMSELIGPLHYNEGLRDAHAALLGKMDDLAEAIDRLEKPVDARRR